MSRSTTEVKDFFERVAREGVDARLGCGFARAWYAIRHADARTAPDVCRRYSRYGSRGSWRGFGS